MSVQASINSLQNQTNGNDDDIAANTFAIGVNTAAINFFWTIFGTVLVFWMHAGFSLLEAGSIRHKNIVSIMFKNLLNVIVSSILWWFFGYAFAFGKDSGSFIGGAGGKTDSSYTLHGYTTGIDLSHWIFQWAFAATSLTIVSGGMAERAATYGYLILIFGFQLIVYPVVAHWCWSSQGWLAQRGFLDFAGSGVVHTVGGFASLIGCIFLGPRRGKTEAHSVPLVVLGTFILWMGWFGFNGASGGIHGSTEVVGVTLINTTLAASIAGIVTVFAMKAMTGKYLVGEMCNGILAGLVAITAPCNNVADWAAFIIGLIAAIVYIAASKLLKVAKIDDAIGAFPVHGACGVWGVIAAGLFDRTSGGFYLPSGSNAFGVQCYGILAIVAWTVVTSCLFLGIAKLLGVLRIPENVEVEGIDAHYHNEEAEEFPQDGALSKIFKH